MDVKPETEAGYLLFLSETKYYYYYCYSCYHYYDYIHYYYILYGVLKCDYSTRMSSISFFT